jgi:pimeloyl-ACP methyl ester carboxylesterase
VTTDEASTGSAAELIDEWRALGRNLSVGGDDVFVIDAAATSAATVDSPPLLIIHGFPTSSIDFSPVLPALRAERRVVLLDLPGFGLSAKPDRAYSMFGQADVVEAVVADLGLTEVDLLTHDMGDTVGGEVLARGLDGTLGFSIRRRVLSNGSIYLGLAHLTDGQKLLSSLPDEQLPDGLGPEVDNLVQALLDTMAPTGSPASTPDHAHVRAEAELISRAGGNRLLPRTIRYLDERRRFEERFTGAIEAHASPLTVVWGDLDPIAVYAMTDQLLERRADAVRIRLEGVGHYPMVEAPSSFADAVLSGL